MATALERKLVLHLKGGSRNSKSMEIDEARSNDVQGSDVQDVPASVGISIVVHRSLF